MANPTDNAPGSMLKPQGQPSDTPPTPYVPAGAPNVVSYNLQKVNPPTVVYLQRDDALTCMAVSVTSPVVVTITGRLLRAADGVIVPFTSTLKVTPANTIIVGTTQLAEGFLLSVSAVTDTVTRTFISLFISRGAVTAPPLVGETQALCSDYVTRSVPIGWPGSAVAQPGRFIFQQNTINTSNPSAGADFAVVGNAPTMARVLSFTATFVASGSAGNRQIDFTFGNPQSRIGALAAVTAGQTVKFFGVIGAGSYTTAAGSIILQIPQGLAVFGAVSGPTLISSITAGILAGDQWSAISTLIEESFYF